MRFTTSSKNIHRCSVLLTTGRMPNFVGAYTSLPHPLELYHRLLLPDMQDNYWPPSNLFLPVLHTHVPGNFDMGNTMKYFVKRTAPDGKSANDFQNISSRAFPLFMDGHVQDIEAYRSSSGDTTYYQANCLPEMKKNIIYSIRIVINSSNADIMYAQCGCVAGKGPRGSCKHLGAMCYALVDFRHISQPRDHVSCTSKLQTWNQPRKHTLDTADVGEIKFVKMEYGKTKRKPMVVPYDPCPIALQRTTPEEIQALRQALEHKGDDIGLLHVLQDSELTSTPLGRLPLVPKSARERVRSMLAKQCQPVSIGDILLYSQKLVEFLIPASSEIVAIEVATRKQHD